MKYAETYFELIGGIIGLHQDGKTGISVSGFIEDGYTIRFIIKVTYKEGECEVEAFRYQYYFHPQRIYSNTGSDILDDYVHSVGEKCYVLAAVRFGMLLEMISEFDGVLTWLDISRVRSFIMELEDFVSEKSAVKKRNKEIGELEKEIEEKVMRKMNLGASQVSSGWCLTKEQKTYLMVDKATGYYKIGKSYDPKYRESTLLGMRPTIELLWTHEQNIESKLHKKFADKRIRGEWFALTQEDICEIKSLS